MKEIKRIRKFLATKYPRNQIEQMKDYKIQEFWYKKTSAERQDMLCAWMNEEIILLEKVFHMITKEEYDKQEKNIERRTRSLYRIYCK